jgi:hypothetical protein
MTKRKEADQPVSLEVGRNYLVESITANLYVGRLVSIEGPHTVVLADAAWVADTGRLHLFLRDGQAPQMEVEPVGVRCIHWASWSPWSHDLFTESI